MPGIERAGDRVPALVAVAASDVAAGMVMWGVVNQRKMMELEMPCPVDVDARAASSDGMVRIEIVHPVEGPCFVLAGVDQLVLVEQAG
jgi:hypothetical protein